MGVNKQGSEIKSLEYKILGNIKKHGYCFYETIKTKTSKPGKHLASELSVWYFAS